MRKLQELNIITSKKDLNILVNENVIINMTEKTKLLPKQESQAAISNMSEPMKSCIVSIISIDLFIRLSRIKGSIKKIERKYTIMINSLNFQFKVLFLFFLYSVLTIIG